MFHLVSWRELVHFSYDSFNFHKNKSNLCNVELVIVQFYLSLTALSLPLSFCFPTFEKKIKKVFFFFHSVKKRTHHTIKPLELTVTLQHCI